MPDDYQHLRESADAAARPVSTIDGRETRPPGDFPPFASTGQDAVLEAIGFKPIPGMIQSVHVVYVEGRGYLVNRRSIIYGGHHGDAPFLDDPQKAVEIVQRETRAAIHALASAHKRATG